MTLTPSSRRRDIIHGQRGVDWQSERDIAEVVMMENRFPDGLSFLLDLLGHRTFVKGPWEDGMGHAQAIVIDPSNSVFEGAADPRCDGLALGW
jgi:gamma-glutamyltranspeptidase/glutathione hydrolase